MDQSFGSASEVVEQLIPDNTKEIMRAIDIALKATKDNQGQFVDVQFEIMGGQFAGQKIFQKFNVVNANTTAQNIGRRELWNWIGGVEGNKDGELLMSRIQRLEGQQFLGTVGIDKGSNGYEDKNKIKKFEPANGAMPSQAPAYQQPQAQQPAYQQPPAQPQQPAYQQPVPTADAGMQQPPANTQPPAAAQPTAQHAAPPVNQAPPQQAAMAPVQQAAPGAEPWKHQ